MGVNFGFGYGETSSTSNPLKPDQVEAYFNKLDELSGGQIGTWAGDFIEPPSYERLINTDYVNVGDINKPKNVTAQTVNQPKSVSATTVNQPKSVSATTVNAPNAVSAKTINAPSAVQAGNVSYQGTGDAPTASYKGLSPDQIQAVGGLGATRLASADKTFNSLLDEINSDASLSVAQKQRQRQLAGDDYGNQSDAIAKEVEAAISQLFSTDKGRELEANIFNAQNQTSNQQFNADKGLSAQEFNVDKALAAALNNQNIGADIAKTNAANALTADLSNQGTEADIAKTNASNALTADLSNQATEADINKSNAEIDLQQGITNLGYKADDISKAFEAAMAGKKLDLNQIELLANIFFGGSGQSSRSSGFNFSNQGGIGLA